MAGRGRGKPTMSFNTEQLGLVKGELPAQVLQPPPAYPMLDLHISNFELTDELNYLVELKREFAEYMRDSVHNVLPNVQKKDIERYSDHYTITDNSEHESKYDWSRMPKELWPQKRSKKTTNLKKKNSRKVTTETKRKRQKIIDDDEDDNDNNKQNTETKLQQRNKQMQTTTTGEVKEIKEEEEEDEENSEEEMEEYEKVDEEMDDGTDYVNNYFDNGEGFDDDDDNLDDGPIY